jgi:UDP-N-acetylmuramyl tripeptide synthase
MADARGALAVLAGRAAATGIRLAGRGGGTALPGHVALKVDPGLLSKLAERLSSGAVVVAGTNGKTTTSRLLAGIFAREGLCVAHNRAGSNLPRGVVSALAQQLPLRGSLDIGVIEADENAMPAIVREVRPRVLLLLNLFRDQLDRYGELETVARHWSSVIESLPAETVLVVNADDPNLAGLAEQTSAQVVRFGLDTAGATLPDLPHAADAAYCRNCEARLTYEAIYVSHLGDFHCPNCGNRRPPLDVRLSRREASGLDHQRLEVDAGMLGGCQTLELALPGLYNAYNLLGAVSVARTLGVDWPRIESEAAAFAPAFGRFERVRYGNLELVLTLAKNPVGFNEIIRTIAESEFDGPIVIAINDLDADGRDVSWLWDVDFERLAEPRFGGPIIAAGIRGYDLAVRMKYAGLAEERLWTEQAGLPLAELAAFLAERMRPGERVVALMTYTALLQFRRALSDSGAVDAFWEQ